MNALARSFVLVTLIIAGAVAFWWLQGPEGDAPPPAVAASDDSRQLSAHVEAPVTGQEPPSRMVGQGQEIPVPAQVPGSLVGTSVPTGWAKVDGFGGLIPTPALRQMFEYYLSALGEESLPQLVARIKQTLSVLAEPARTQALETLGAYLDYKLAVSDLEAGYGEAAALSAMAMQQRMEEIQALRRTWLDRDTADAFFARDEAIDQFQIEKLRIARDQALTEQQRQAALAQAEAALPEPLRQARRETRRFADYEQARQDLAGDPAALQAWREQAFDSATAQRLEALEQEQKAWDRRWQAYSRERQTLTVSGLAGPELQAALDRLRDQHFDDTEQVRAQALDSIR